MCKLVSSRRVALLAVAGAAVVGLAAVAAAQTSSFDVSPFAGYRLGGSFGESSLGDVEVAPDLSYGVTVGVRAGDDWLIEGLWSRQSSDLRTSADGEFGPETTLTGIAVQHLQGGVRWDLGGDGSSVRPFIVFGIGASQFDPDASGLSSEWFFSGNAGGGIDLKLSDRFGLRLAARYYPILVNSDEEVFCELPGGCFAFLDQTFTGQTDLTAGIVISWP